ncbi:MAG: DNA polymerase IV [Cyclobacteriaceae bacterium]|nr:DNA polymerase IV [Cyclobacteriaceae bacterium]
MDKHRKILHIDMDAFFASVEQRDNPELKGKPIAVGGSKERGVVAAASYEARKFGVYSAMPSITAARKCPDLIFVRPRFEAYKQVSEQIRSIFLEYTDLVEPLSLDEAFLDVTTNKKGILSATLIAKEIRKRIVETTQLTASAGISINKFLAKSASDIHKPDGITLIPPENAILFLEQLNISKFFGIGKVTSAKMISLGIKNGLDLKKWKENDLYKHFGKSGKHYYHIVRGIDNRPVNPDRIRKSIGAENTFDKDLTDIKEIDEQLVNVAEILHKRMSKSDTTGRTLTLKIKYTDFKQITRSKTVNYDIKYMTDIITLKDEIIENINFEAVKIRLLGISISNLNHTQKSNKNDIQLTLDF